MNMDQTNNYPPGAVATRSTLASDRTPLLKPWSAKDEAELRDAQRRIDEATARRSIAEQRVCEVLKDAGLVLRPEDATIIGLCAIQHADAIRDALAPFDSGVRQA